MHKNCLCSAVLTEIFVDFIIIILLFETELLRLCILALASFGIFHKLYALISHFLRHAKHQRTAVFMVEVTNQH